MAGLQRICFIFVGVVMAGVYHPRYTLDGYTYSAYLYQRDWLMNTTLCSFNTMRIMHVWHSMSSYVCFLLGDSPT